MKTLYQTHSTETSTPQTPTNTCCYDCCLRITLLASVCLCKARCVVADPGLVPAEELPGDPENNNWSSTRPNLLIRKIQFEGTTLFKFKQAGSRGDLGSVLAFGRCCVNLYSVEVFLYYLGTRLD